MKILKNGAKPLHFWVLFVCLLFSLANLFGCAGGGTSGSGGGGGGIQLSGSLRLQQGGPAAGVTVSAAALPVVRASLRLGKSADRLDNTAVTDQTGAFSLFVDAMPGEDIELLFNSPTVTAKFQVTQIPATAAIVKIDLTYDDETSSINEDDVKYEDENGNEVKESQDGST